MSLPADAICPARSYRRRSSASKLWRGCTLAPDRSPPESACTNRTARQVSWHMSTRGGANSADSDDRDFLPLRSMGTRKAMPFQRRFYAIP
jgi:hypothetical protein